MSSHKPFADLEKIKHLDWEPVCEVHVHTYPPGSSTGVALEPPCTDRAELLVRYHTVTRCRVVEQLMCSSHFRDLFIDMPETHRKCPVCGADRFISRRWL